MRRSSSADHLWLHKRQALFPLCIAIDLRGQCLVRLRWEDGVGATAPRGGARVPRNPEATKTTAWKGSAYDNPRIPPPTFRVGPNHGVRWNSNKDFTNPATVTKELVADFAALVSRGLDPYLIASDPQSVFDYTVYMILDSDAAATPAG